MQLSRFPPVSMSSSSPFDPASLRPLVEPLSPTAIIALYQVAHDRPCWTCPIEEHGGLGSVWTLRERAGDIEQSIFLPVEPSAILTAAEEVLRAKSYIPAGWTLTTLMGVRAWLTVEGGDRGRENACYVQSNVYRPIEVALLVLGQADQLAHSTDPPPRHLRRRDEDEPVIS